MSNIYARQAAVFRNEMRQSCAALIGIAQGLLANGELCDKEILFLRAWLERSQNVALTWPGNIIAGQIEQALLDGYISEKERHHLYTTLEKLVHGALDEAANSPIATLALDEVTLVDIEGRSFCFTGDFAFGPRTTCEAAVLRRGGMVGNVTKKLNYLVVGGLGSAEWKHTSFGTKIEKAIAYRAKGIPLKIVHENIWATSLAC